jgi:CDGSH-type Zn-finger protein
MDEADPSISSVHNGPLRVTNVDDLKDHKGNTIETRKVFILCRCGGSARKPFCDGAHSKMDWVDEKSPDRVPNMMDNYVGEVLEVHDNRGVCSHRGNCTDNAPKVFLMNTEPWIDPAGDDPDHTAGVIETCPSGALSYTKDGVLHKDLEREPSITVVKDGPYDVVGGIHFTDDEGDEAESKEHFTLCRCGRSQNKPFCNGQHWYVDFKDPVD